MKPFQYLRPKTVSEAVSMALDNPEAQYIAGGTNLIDLMKRGIASPPKLIDINHLPLKKIEHRYDRIRIGALALNSDVAQHKLVKTRQPLLAEALLAGASGQIRNMATVGGNLLQRTRCSYFYDVALPCNKRKPGSGCGAEGGINRTHAIFFNGSEVPSCIAVHPSDMCVALAALDTSVVVAGPAGERRILFKDLHRLSTKEPEMDTTLNPGELITSIEVLDNAFTGHSHYLKVRDRASYAFALVSVAAALQMDGGKIWDARLALGGVAHKPWRYWAIELMLRGQPPSEKLFREVAEHELQSARAGEHNAYKIKLTANAMIAALKIAAGIS
ncbi:xanthine dehydrogenase family protein subunit M [Dyadobacter sp. CY261]|uniref:FAD binding domain-containing protein n=1 Tax=Dyadobacter sp. CY261 TaxID=2907203 RepID=UPI001F3B70F2|nr:xanthine dehydrogenase family protein subunit M [Dyadobacter sp. CY261]MCF0074327.1 xanthine dehydrogenase family protein subunit M [Dyadobacter sp. CY261]